MSENKELIVCPKCSQRLSVPSGLGVLAVTCPSCRFKWDWPAEEEFIAEGASVSAGPEPEPRPVRSAVDDRLKKFVPKPPQNRTSQRLDRFTKPGKPEDFFSYHKWREDARIEQLRRRGYYVVAVRNEGPKGDYDTIVGVSKTPEGAQNIKNQHPDFWDDGLDRFGQVINKSTQTITVILEPIA